MPATKELIVARRQVVVVDACVDDYSRLFALTKKQSIRLTITTAGAGGLRLAPSFPDALWLVSTRLPDMNGLNLLEMLRSLAPKLTAFVVDHSYDEENERHAFRLSAARYLCKPVDLNWVEAWRGPPSVAAPATTASNYVPLKFGERI